MQSVIERISVKPTGVPLSHVAPNEESLAEPGNENTTTIAVSPPFDNPALQGSQDGTPALLDDDVPEQRHRSFTSSSVSRSHSTGVIARLRRTPLLGSLQRRPLGHLKAQSPAVTQSLQEAPDNSVPRHQADTLAQAADHHSTSSSPPRLSSQELRVLRLVALCDEGKSELPLPIHTGNFRLRWLLHPSNAATGSPQRRSTTASDIQSSSSSHRHNSQVASLNLNTMTTSMLFDSPVDASKRALLNSPRSILVCLRNGVQPLSLQRMPLSQLALQLGLKKPTREDQGEENEDAVDPSSCSVASSGYGTDQELLKHAAMLEARRVADHRFLQQEYNQLCQWISLAQVKAFFEFAALEDPLQAPEVVQGPSGEALVQVMGDTVTVKAVAAIEAKAASERARVAQQLASERRTMEGKAAAFAAEQRANADRQRRQQEELERREAQRREQALMREEIAATKRAKRERMAEEAALALAEAAKKGEEKALAAEAAAAASMKARAEQRARRSEEKLAKQQQRLTMAEKKVERIREAQLADYEAKQRLQQGILRQRTQERLIKQEEDALKREEQRVRREAVAQRSVEALAQRQEQAAAASKRVAERLVEFEHQKEDQQKLRQLVDLRREVTREEVFQLNAQQQSESVRLMVERREAHERAVFQQQKEQAERREERRQEDRLNGAQQAQQRHKRQQRRLFDVLVAVEEIHRGALRGDQVKNMNETQRVRATLERDVVAQSRKLQAQQASKANEHTERSLTMSVWREVHPSDATKLHSINQHHVSKLRAARQRMLTPSLSPVPNADTSVERPSSVMF